MCAGFLLTEKSLQTNKKNISHLFFNLCQPCELMKRLQSVSSLTPLPFRNSNQ